MDNTRDTEPLPINADNKQAPKGDRIAIRVANIGYVSSVLGKSRRFRVTKLRLNYECVILSGPESRSGQSFCIVYIRSG